MKVVLEDRYKEFYTVLDLERAKEVIRQEKEDLETAKGWAEYAVHEALKGSDDYLLEVLKASAHTARNLRVWDAYSVGSADMDVWIDALAETRWGFVRVGAYLSDIWQTGAISYKEHMYIKRYKEA